MKQIKHTIKILTLVVALLLSGASTVFALTDEEYESNLSHYKELCSGYYSENDRATCEGYKDYLKRKASNQASEKDEIAANRKDIEKDLASNLHLIEEYRTKISGFEADIQTLQGTIAYKEADIAKLQEEIEVHRGEIVKLEEDVKAYMVNTQSTMRVNGYIEFIMGSHDFADIVRRVEGMNAIKRFNETVVNDLRTERAKLEESEIALQNEKDDLEIQVLNVENEKAKAALYQEEVEYIYAELEKQSEILLTAEAEIQNSISIGDALWDQLGELAPPPVIEEPGDPETPGTGGETGPGGSGDVSRPVYGGRITETVWHYSNSSIVHLGNDVAASRGTPIYSIGTGIVLVTTGGCATTGSMGCNGGMGNHIATMFEYNGTVYGTLTMHIQKDSFKVSPGQIVQAGQAIANVGNSGNSYGDHAHVEIFYLGEDGLKNALNRWNTEQRTAQFGLGGSSGGLWSACSNKGSYPCRLDPGGFVY